jgi:dTDP-4-amino-4,6-dideoxygalactose transaminase
MDRIFLSPPDVGPLERQLLIDAFDSNWIAPLGPHVDGFEQEFARTTAMPHATALSSGTAALHLALLALGIERGHRVACSTLTFAATANAITYVGAEPVFVDSDRATWTMSPDLLREALTSARRGGRPIKAVITVDLYGQCCDYEPIERTCDEFGVVLIEDAAESLGASYRGKPAGSFGKCAAFSFNGNKIITTSGGGMLVSSHADLINRTRHLATQAREPAAHYEHKDVGYNYRMSNLLAAGGRGQLAGLREKVERRRVINGRYREALGGIEGLTFMPEADYGRSNCWLTCIQVDAAAVGVSREDIRLHLESLNIEARPVWKPMHLQPAFRASPCVGGAVAADLFGNGLCLPSGSSLSDADLERVIDGLFASIGRARSRGTATLNA